MARKLILLALFIPFFVACSDDDGDSKTDTGINDAIVADTALEKDSAIPDHQATDLKFGLHANLVKCRIATLEVVGQQETDYDFYVAHDDPVDNSPTIRLGPNVKAQNLGHDNDFHAVDTAPDSGYLADEGDSLAIGSQWRTGGTGTTGYIMSEDIFVLELADGSYAKIEVLSAKAGEVHILVYRGEGKDLSTTE